MTSTSTGTSMPTTRSPEASAIAEGRAVLGIELGSTRIKGVLVDRGGQVLAVGEHTWENRLVDGRWTYAEDDIWGGLQQCYSAVAADADARHGIRPSKLAALGVSGMMHGYLPTDTEGELLVPFRTWRNTSTGQAAAELTALLGVNIPLRWSVAHLYQAILDAEPHVTEIAGLTTLAGLVHHRLSGLRVLGVGDASGMFPIDPATKDYDADALLRFDGLIADRCPDLHFDALLPKVLAAGQEAGHLSAEGAKLLDPTGTLLAGAPMCPPEGDAGTGMVATNAVTPRTGNVSVGTSIFAMAVLEHPLRRVHHAIDIVTTPAGDPVAMVHCNNGASELDAWAALFGELATALGFPASRDTVFAAMLSSALGAEADAGGLVAFNYLAGEPVAGLEVGRPLFLRTPDSRLTLGSFVRAQVFGAFATLALGMRALAEEDVALDVLVAHGGLFRTEGVAQRLLAGALDTHVQVGRSAGEGGAWGIAVLARYLADDTNELELGAWLNTHIFDDGQAVTVTPEPADVAGFATYLARFEAGLAVERAAATAV
jgi:sugar (pentulose or hexulose) kinase